MGVSKRIPWWRYIVAHFVQNKILVWGGTQKQPNGGSISSPRNVIHVYNISHGTWIDIPAQGKIHDWDQVGSVAHDDLIYLFGGDKFESDNEIYSNDISTLSAEGMFQKISIEGDLPAPRNASVGWSFEENLFFGFGGLGEDQESQGSCINGGDTEDYGAFIYTNQILCFNLRSRQWSNFSTAGTQPKAFPRPAHAKLKHKVYIQTRDFHVLDMKTQQWTRLPAVNLPTTLNGASLSVVGRRQIMLLGGGSIINGISKSVWLYNTRDASWTENRRIPPEFYGEDDGLRWHTAVEVRRGIRVSKVLCFGGYLKHDYTKHPSNIVEFDIPQ